MNHLAFNINGQPMQMLMVPAHDRDMIAKIAAATPSIGPELKKLTPYLHHIFEFGNEEAVIEIINSAIDRYITQCAPLFEIVEGKDPSEWDHRDSRYIEFYSAHEDLNRLTAGVYGSVFLEQSPSWALVAILAQLKGDSRDGEESEEFRTFRDEVQIPISTSLRKVMDALNVMSSLGEALTSDLLQRGVVKPNFSISLLQFLPFLASHRSLDETERGKLEEKVTAFAMEYTRLYKSIRSIPQDPCELCGGPLRQVVLTMQKENKQAYKVLQTLFPDGTSAMNDEFQAVIDGIEKESENYQSVVSYVNIISKTSSDLAIQIPKGPETRAILFSLSGDTPIPEEEVKSESEDEEADPEALSHGSGNTAIKTEETEGTEERPIKKENETA